MRYLDKIDLIINKLKSNGFLDKAEIIISSKENSFTSSELLSSVSYNLILIVKDDKELQSLIGKEVGELADYCLSIGLKIKNHKDI